MRDAVRSMLQLVKQRDLQMHEGSFLGLIITCCPHTKAGVPTATLESFGIASLFWAASLCFLHVPCCRRSLWRVRNWWGSNQRPSHYF
jgi:hypothetical protein